LTNTINTLLEREFDAFADGDVLAEMRRAAMARCLHWSAARAQYEELYARLIISDAS
jgi:hypothetical protein